MRNILILCTGNSCRSQIAEAYLKHFLGDKANIYSAGVETHGVNPRAIKTMKAVGIDMDEHTSNHIDEYSALKFDTVITVCDHAKERCPVLPSAVKHLHYNFPDPAKASGTEAEIMQAFDATRDQIKTYLEAFALEF